MKTTQTTVTVGGKQYAATACSDDYAMAFVPESNAVAILGRVVGASDTHEMLAIVSGPNAVFIARAAIIGLASGKIQEENLVSWKNSVATSVRGAA